MTRSLISYSGRNYIDDPATLIQFSSGDYTSVDGYPLDNLRSRQLSDTARWLTAGLPGIVSLDVILPEPKPVAVVGLLGANFREANHVANLTVNTYAAGNWTEPYTVVDNQDRGVRGLPYNLIAAMPLQDGGAPVVEALRITAEWDAIGALFTEAARLWVGDAIIIPTGVDAQWDLSVIDTGRVEESKGKQAYEDPGPRIRQINCTLTQMEAPLAFGFAEGAVEAPDVPSFNDLQLAAGATGEVLVITRAETPVWVRRTAVYGRMAGAAPKIAHVGGGYYSTSISAIEER